jgi:hypothetical protein
MPSGKIVVDVVFEIGDEVNWMGCNGYVVTLVLGEGFVCYEAQLKSAQEEIVVGRFQAFELHPGHTL